MTASEPTEDDLPFAVVKHSATGHDGAGWYYWDEDYPDEGAAGAFETREEAEAHARDEGGYRVRDFASATRGLPTFSRGGMGGALPCRLVVEDGHGKPSECAATESDLAAVLAVLPPEQRERVLRPYLEEARRKVRENITYDDGLTDG